MSAALWTLVGGAAFFNPLLDRPQLAATRVRVPRADLSPYEDYKQRLLLLQKESAGAEANKPEEHATRDAAPLVASDTPTPANVVPTDGAQLSARPSLPQIVDESSDLLPHQAIGELCTRCAALPLSPSPFVRPTRSDAYIPNIALLVVMPGPRARSLSCVHAGPP